MQDQDKILYFLRASGPTTPTAVAKNIRTEVLLASALLSDLSSQGKVKISKLKIGGGSPLYYLPGHESQLFKFAEGNVNHKDYQVLLVLKERKLLRERDLDLLARVALRHLQDFAIPLNVNFQGTVELFWKWYLINNEEANQLIGRALVPQQETKKVIEEISETKEELKEPVEERVEIVVESELVKDNIEHNVDNNVKTITTTNLGELGVKEPLHLADNLAELETETEQDNEKQDNKEQDNEEQIKEIKKVKEEQKKLESPAVKKSFFDKVKEKVVKKRKPIEDEFLPHVEKYFKKINISIDQTEIVRKNSEMNFIVKVPSAVGKITYFCKAKSKNKCDEKDLSTAYMEAQIKKLPLLLLYSNEITKKMEDMLSSDAFENAVIKKID
ncbi:hypothetical protein COY27_01860 [Candidatus Woesearchaeota archaeon CG_4_10_14_0_2_um_filter_33_13]|nr:MAG: hypothetical protein COY27_01860 [Candidatus Woesearchaeota archaeon CG_4_10_14_0_2_um_filter_33_13]